MNKSQRFTERYPDAKRADFPKWIGAMKATLTDDYFDAPDWIFERKLDGERVLAFCKDGNLELYSRNQKKLDRIYPEILKDHTLSRHDAVLDGEVVAFEGEVTSFSRLQKRMHVSSPQEAEQSGIKIAYYVFDIMYLDGFDIRKVPLADRKRILRNTFDFKEPVRFLPHLREHGKKYLDEACKKGWEGLIAKDSGSRYVSSRSRKWLKFKCVNQQELIIIGYTTPGGSRVGFGAIYVGYYQDGTLKNAGKVGTGFDDTELKELKQEFDKIKTNDKPVNNVVEDKDVTWLKPELVAEIGFTEWTEDNKLRHPRYLGMRRDKNARDVIKEEP